MVRGLGPLSFMASMVMAPHPTWEQMQGLLSTPDLLSPYRDTPHWRLALQREEEKRQEDTAKRQGDIKKRIQKALEDGGDP